MQSLFGQRRVIAYDLAKQNSNLIIPQVLKLLDEVCDKSGQTVDSGGDGFSYDLFLDMLEKIEISFDKNNEPIKPTLIMHPDVAEKIKEIKPTKEQELREKLIWERKKVDFIAKKRIRRLL